MSGLVKKKILAESDDEEAERVKKKLKKAEPSLFNDDDDDDEDETPHGKKRELDYKSSVNKKRSPSSNKIGSSKTNSSKIESSKRGNNKVDRTSSNVESKSKEGNKNRMKQDKTLKRQTKEIKKNIETILSSNDDNSDESEINYSENKKLKNASSSRHSNSSPNPQNVSNVQSPKNLGKKGELSKLLAAQNTYDIRSFFKSGKSSNNVESREQFRSNTNQIPVKDVNEYFDQLENDQNRKKAKSNSPSNIKKGRSGNNDDMSPLQKKIKTDTGGRSPTHVKDNVDGTVPSFDYLLFNNQKIVITGVFSKYTRDELTYKIKELGGSVMSAVSSKTNYLIHGELLEDGRLYTEGNKYKKAKDLLTQGKSNIKILNEEEFLQLLPENNNDDKNTANAYNEYGENANVEGGGVSPNLKGEVYSSNSNTFSLQTNDFGTPEQNDLGATDNKEGEIINQLWVEKYRPKNISELVGNNTNVVKLQNWLASWEDVCIRGFKKEVKKTFRGVFENVNAPCALLSGPAGIGKTTTAKIVAEQSGYNVIEFNASDERNKAAVEKISEMTSGGYTLTSMHNTKLRKTCIIMDEVDGMSSGDKGGSTAILKLIEKTKCPIICICNDRQNPKIRTLANKCYDLKFHAPQKQAVIKRVMQIALKEGLVLEPNALELLCDSTNSDLRQILNTLQLLSKTYKRMNFADIKKELSNSNKTLLTLANPFEVCLKLLNFNEASKLKIRDIIDLFFVDHELIPFFISENYANIFNDNNKADLEKKWDGYGKIAFDLSLAEIVKYDLKTNMDFSLLPHFCVLCCVCPVLRIRLLKCYMSGRVNFPSALGKISSFNKNKRLLQELCFCLSFKLNMSPKVLITSGFLNYLYVKLVTPLSKNNPQETLDIMEEYNITKEMITEHFPCLRLQKQENLYDKLDSKTKAAFTRLYNSSHVIKTDPNLLKNTFKTDKKTAASFKLTDRDSDEEEGGDTTDAASKEDDDDPLIKNTLSRKQTMKAGKTTTPRAKGGGKKKK